MWMGTGEMTEFKMVDDRKPKPVDEPKKIKFGRARKLTQRDYSAYTTIRPDKVEEIKAVWDSPKSRFRNNNERLVYLFRHCTSAEYGYTIREFAQAKFPEKMKDYDGEYLVFKALHQMFRRFRQDELNHEVVLAGLYRKLKNEPVGRWYYWNVIDDDEAMDEVNRFNYKMWLGLTRAQQENQDIIEHSEEIKAELDRHIQEIENRVKEADRKEELKKKQEADRYIDTYKIGRRRGPPDPDQTKL